MGSVVKVYKNKKFVGWQARICRVGIPKFTLSFCTYEDAVEWLNDNEEKYIYDQEILKGINRLDKTRCRRKERTGKI